MGLGNPVGPGRIQPNSETWDRTSYRVTSTFAQHVASGRGPGIDFGNGRCGGQVLAMADGHVSQRFTDPNGANVLRIRHSATEVSGYAHWSTSPLSIGAIVTRGQVVAAVGKTGTAACHLHAGYTIAGREVDFWPMLDQNQLPDTGTGGPMTQVTITPYPAPRQCGIAAGATVQGWNATALVKSQIFAAASSFRADADVVIDQTPNQPPEGLFRRALDGVFAGLYVPSPQVTLAPPPPDPVATAYNKGLADARAAVEAVPPK